MAKNCYSCKELYYDTEQDSDGFIIGEGWCCDKQYYKYANISDIKADGFVDRLQTKEYKNKGKICCEEKELTNANR